MNRLFIVFGAYAIGLVFALKPRVSLRPFPEELVETYRDRISHKRFMNFEVSKSAPKIILPIGIPEDPTDLFIDTIPVSIRIHIINATIAENAQFAKNHPIRRILHSDLKKLEENSPARIYLHYLLGSIYMESGILDSFFTVAYAHPHRLLSSLKTCTEFVALMRVWFQCTYNYSLDHVTPRIVHDWFWLLSQKSLFRLNAPFEYAHDRNQTSIPPLQLVNLETQPWREIFTNRLNRLTLTGYENIDL